MTNSGKNSDYDIGEFCSYELTESQEKKKFRIVLEGDIKYSNLVSIKVGNLKFSEDELVEWVED